MLRPKRLRKYWWRTKRFHDPVSRRILSRIPPANPCSRIGISVTLTKLIDRAYLSTRQLRREDLKRNRIARHARKMVVPDPLGDRFAPLDTDTLVRAHHLLLLLSGRPAQILREARPNNQDICKLELGPLVLGDSLQVRDCDRVVVEAGVFDTLGFGVSFVVEEDATADEAATLVPVYTYRAC
jgi:hypothetical protein